MHALLAILGNIAGFVVRESKAWLRWARQMGLLAYRNAQALLIWVAAHTAARVILMAAVVAAFEVFTLWVTTNAITPLVSDFIHRCIPSGSAGDGLVWILWDTGLNGSALFSAFVVYLANYTALWRAFDVYLRAQMVAVSTFKAALRRAQAVHDSSRLT